MRQITFGRAVPGHNPGDRRVVPDHIAAALDAAGELTANEPWPPGSAAAPAPAPPAKRPERPSFAPRRRSGVPDSRRIQPVDDA